MAWNKIKLHELKEIVKLHKRKLSLDKIGKRVNCDGSSVRYWLVKLGIYEHPSRKPKLSVFKNMGKEKRGGKKIYLVKKKPQVMKGKSYQELLNEVKKREPKLYDGY